MMWDANKTRCIQVGMVSSKYTVCEIYIFPNQLESKKCSKIRSNCSLERFMSFYRMINGRSRMHLSFIKPVYFPRKTLNAIWTSKANTLRTYIYFRSDIAILKQNVNFDRNIHKIICNIYSLRANCMQ